MTEHLRWVQTNPNQWHQIVADRKETNMGEQTLFDHDGFVNRPASKERALRESADGTRSARHKKVLQHLDLIGPAGCTWRELGERFSLHHGQISGCLSTLHKSGEVFTLKIQRDRCHPYIHAKYRNMYAEEDRFDEPVRTSINTRAMLVEAVYEVAVRMCDDLQVFITGAHGHIVDRELTEAVRKVQAFDGNRTTRSS